MLLFEQCEEVKLRENKCWATRISKTKGTVKSKKRMTSNAKRSKSRAASSRGKRAASRRKNAANASASSSASSDSGRNYKTEMCNKWLERGECPYGNKCQFAHGESELRSGAKHLDSRYKQSVCRNFHEKGSCPYGKRCRFIHNETPEELELLRKGVSPDQVCIVIGDSHRFSRSGETTAVPSDSIPTVLPSYPAVVSALPPMTTHVSAPPPSTIDLVSIFSDTSPPSLVRQNSGVQDDILREVTTENNVSYMKAVEDSDAPVSPPAAVPLQRQSTTELLLNLGKRRDNGLKRNSSLFFDIPASPGGSQWDWTTWQSTQTTATLQKPWSGVLASVA